MKFSVITADPPWQFSDELKMSDVPRGAKSNYNTLSTDDLCSLPVKDIADPDGCVLALWVIGSMLEDGLKVMKAWGFEQKQVYVWVKVKKDPFEPFKKIIFKSLASAVKLKKSEDDKTFFKSFVISAFNLFKLNDILSFGMGRLFRQTHEICLIGTRGKVYKNLKNKSQRSVSFEFNQGHSIKPSKLQDSLDLMFEGNKLEMFARRDRNGWICVGLECPSSLGEDIKDSLERVSRM